MNFLRHNNRLEMIVYSSQHATGWRKMRGTHFPVLASVLATLIATVLSKVTNWITNRFWQTRGEAWTRWRWLSYQI